MTRIPITRPDLGESEAQAAARVIRSGWIAQGDEVRAFEEELAAAVGAPYAVAVSSGTTALELSLRALGVGAGDDVVTVSHSFIATANAVRAVGAHPVFVDVDPDTFGMDARALEPALTPRTKAVLCAHQLGFPCAIEAIAAITERRGVALLEDAACALGSEVLVRGAWRRIGSPFGLAACFSFHPRKLITTGEGGMITTSDRELAERLRRLRQHGASTTGVEEFLEPGFNARMTDIQAAIGRPQLARLGAILARRREIAVRFSRALAENRVLAPPVESPTVHPNWQSYPAQLRAGAPAQDLVLQRLLEHGVTGRRGVTNAHQAPAYAALDRRATPGSLAVSERLRESTVLLPIFQGLSEEEVGCVLDALQALDRPLPNA
jgi:dTDP-4-amino-4,6-dideoxygalactose transaminase